MSTLQPAPSGPGGTFLGVPPFPRAARAAVRDARSRGNPRHATHSIRDTRAKAVAALDLVEATAEAEAVEVASTAARETGLDAALAREGVTAYEVGVERLVPRGDIEPERVEGVHGPRRLDVVPLGEG